MAKDKILKQKVHHDGVSMVVLKEGNRYAVPDALRQTWIDEGVIAGMTSKEISKEEAERAATDQDDGDGEKQQDEEQDEAPLFTAKHIAGGLYEITGPGLEHPERVRGRTETDVRISELTEAHKALTAADGSGAPPV